MSTWGLIVIYAYFILLFVLCLYGIHRYVMVFLYYRYKNKPHVPPAEFKEFPVVTIQLPTFNEMYVAERLIDSVCAIRYPREKLEIQVLDDSIDECQDVCKRAVAKWQAAGLDIQYIHRVDRTGYKAGALDNGLKTAKGEFVAVFDADFVPTPDFLEKTIHHFTDEKVAVVQTRWDHVNRDYSNLTNVQAILLDGHFMIEHTARNRSGRFMNFSGTAGLWRKCAIADSGGWTADTLTEDLDISFRAQMRGWRFVFLPNLTTPAELPVEMSAFKTQQHRWAKGSAQTSRKLLWDVVRCRIPWFVKLEAVMHLTSNSMYVLALVMSIMMLPCAYFRSQLEWQTSGWLELIIFAAATVSVCVYYMSSQRETIGSGWLKQLRHVPLLLSVALGLAVNNARAVIEGWLQKGGEFVRTPKHAIAGRQGSVSGKKYRGIRPWMVTAFEFLMGCYFVFIITISAMSKMYAAIPFQCLFLVGFYYLSLHGVVQRLKKPAPAAVECASS